MDSSASRIGWIGTGAMGAAMCGHLMAAGHPAVVYNRTRERADGLVAAGAGWRDSPAAVAADCDVVFTIVGTPDDVREVVLGEEGVFAGSSPGQLLVDMTTSSPALAAELAAEGERIGVDVLDAPVSGGDIGAQAGTLAIMVGGSPAAFERARPLLEPMGSNIQHLGGPGAGQHTKMANQIAIASLTVGVCESLTYAARAGLDVAQVIDTIKGGAAGSWSLSNLGPRMVAGDYAPGFKIDHFVKDLGIALEGAEEMELPLDGVRATRELYRAIQEQGGGQQGTQALVTRIAELSNISWPPAGADTRENG